MRAGVGARAGRARTLAAIAEVLSEYGYEPRTAGKSIALGNCPFHNLARSHPELVCGMNLDVMSALVEGVSPGALRARLTPTPGRCCVTINATR